MNLAASLGVLEKKVLLIDADPQANATSGLGIDVESIELGTYQLIENSITAEEAIISTNSPNLDLIPSHIDLVAIEIELVDKENRESMLKNAIVHLKDKYDYIIVDTSAVGLVSDTLLISKFADMFLYVVSADNIDKRHLVAIAKPLFEDHRLPRMNVLLNGTNFDKKGYGYGYGYGENPGKEKKWYQFS